MRASMNFEISGFGQVDLTDCDREPIHIPGSIQPHGVLLAVDPETLAVVQIAGDCRRFFHIDPKDLIGRSLRAWIGPAPIERLNLLLAGNLIVPKPFFAVEISVEEARFDLLAHVSDGLLILEAEPCAESSRNGVELVQGMLARLQTSSVKAMLDSLAAEVQAVTGFDRVMVYRFGDDDSGHVVAERLSSSDVVSFYDLHYPASDIPAQARELYRKNWIRFIPDSTYSPWPLEPPLNPKTGKPLDLGFSTLRSVSPIHLEYLANMGVRSSMSLSIMIGDKLWGLVACHAAQPLRLSCCVRASLELFAQLVSLQLRTMLELEESTKRSSPATFRAP
jgi:light-regulated signal transduction histidine kinase (bacteriophytochrome)